jgi:hypothetical protein
MTTIRCTYKKYISGRVEGSNQSGEIGRNLLDTVAANDFSLTVGRGRLLKSRHRAIITKRFSNQG